MYIFCWLALASHRWCRLSSNVRPRILTVVVHRLLRYISFLAFVPLSVFLVTLQFHEAKYPDRWAYAFLYTFVPAVVLSVAALAIFRRCDKLWLGSNLWFSLLGSLSAAQAWGPLEFLATSFKESGGFVLTAVIGVIACVVAPGSFVGVARSAKGAQYAWLLTAIAITVAAVSYFAQGTRHLSITVPVVVFLGSNYVLRRLLRRAGAA